MAGRRVSDVLNDTDIFRSIDFDFENPNFFTSLFGGGEEDKLEDVSNLDHSFFEINNNYELIPQQSQWSDTAMTTNNQLLYTNTSLPMPSDPMRYAPTNCINNLMNYYPNREPYNESANYEYTPTVQYNNHVVPPPQQVVQQCTPAVDPPHQFANPSPNETLVPSPELTENKMGYLPESVVQINGNQLNGQLLTVQEFSDHHSEIISAHTQNQMLSCPEKIGDYSTENSLDSVNSGQTIGSSVVMVNKINASQQQFPVNKGWTSGFKKTFLAPRVATYHSKTNPVLMKSQDMVYKAADGLVILSSKRKEVRTKMAKGEWARLDYNERTRIKRERNRIAAKKCRLRKIETIEKYNSIRDLLVEDNKRCQIYLNQLRTKLTQMQLGLLRHCASDECQALK